jgi:hypothetical protein
MRYNNQLNNPKNTTTGMPSGDVTVGMGLMGDTNANIAPPIPQPVTYNPGIKATGAPVSFNPKSQAAMTGMFGMPADGTYDRTLPIPPTV